MKEAYDNNDKDFSQVSSTLPCTRIRCVYCSLYFVCNAYSTLPQSGIGSSFNFRLDTVIIVPNFNFIIPFSISIQYFCLN
jgi:hypothetical protein